MKLKTFVKAMFINKTEQRGNCWEAIYEGIFGSLARADLEHYFAKFEALNQVCVFLANGASSSALVLKSNRNIFKKKREK